MLCQSAGSYTGVAVLSRHNDGASGGWSGLWLSGATGRLLPIIRKTANRARKPGETGGYPSQLIVLRGMSH
jgi:hypothetical protein